MPKVSVIIPIYNVEKYLVKCLDSVCSQSLKDIEIICVNDGATDKCIEICKEFRKKDSRIKMINKKNGGLSSARNAGLNIANGNYIYFLDPDDYIEINALDILVTELEKAQCDILISGYRTNLSDEKISPLYAKNKVLNPIAMIKSNSRVHSHNDLSFVWRYCFKRELLERNKIRFNEEVRVGEDFIFNLEALIKAKKVLVLDECLYIYTVNNFSSIMKTPYKSYLEESLKLQYDIKKKLSIDCGLYECETYRRDMALYYINSFLPMILRNIYNGPEEDKKQAIKRILNYKMFSDSFKVIGIGYSNCNYKEYIAYLMMKFRVYPVVYKFIDKQYKVEKPKEEFINAII